MQCTKLIKVIKQKIESDNFANAKLKEQKPLCGQPQRKVKYH